MKIKISKLNYIIIIAILVLDVSFFYLFHLPDWFVRINSLYSKTLIITILLPVVVLCLLKNKNYLHQFRFVNRYCTFVVMLCIILIMHGRIAYSINLFTLFNNCSFLLPILLIIPLLSVSRLQNSYETIVRICAIVVFIMSVLLIIQGLVYATSGNFFLTYFGETSYIFTRNGRLRIFSIGLDNLITIYFFSKIISGDRRLFSLVMVIIGVVCNFFIAQTRSLEFALVAAFAVVLLFNSKNKKKVLRNYALLIVAIIALVASGVLDSFINSFFSGSESGNTTIRVSAISYYLDYWIHHPLLGMGLSNSETLVHGPFGKYYMSDVGFIGILARCGIFAFGLYIPLAVRWIIIIRELLKGGKEYHQTGALLAGFFTLMFAPAYSLSFFTVQYIINMPILIYFFEYNYMKYRGVR